MPKKIDLAKYSLERICFDYGLECTFQLASRWVTLRFTAALLSNGELIDINKVDSVILLIRLLHLELIELCFDDESILRVVFKNEEVLQVNPIEEFESWELLTSEDLRWVCMPGGEVAEWN